MLKMNRTPGASREAIAAAPPDLPVAAWYAAMPGLFLALWLGVALMWVLAFPDGAFFALPWLLVELPLLLPIAAGYCALVRYLAATRVRRLRLAACTASMLIPLGSLLFDL